MKKILTVVMSLLVCAALNAQNEQEELLPGSWVREKGEIVEVGLLEGESRCLTYEEIQSKLSAEDFIAMRKALHTYDIGVNLIVDGIGYAAGYALAELFWCKMGGYEFSDGNFIMLGVGAVTALAGVIMVPIGNRKIDRIIDSYNSSIGLGRENERPATITILPTAVTLNGQCVPASGSAAARVLNVAPGIGINVRF